MNRWERVTTSTLGAVMLGGALWGVGAGTVAAWLEAWTAAGRSAPLLQAAMLVALAAAWLAALVRFGPVARSAPRLQWEGPTPVTPGERWGLVGTSVAVTGLVVAVVAVAPSTSAVEHPGLPPVTAGLVVAVVGVVLAAVARAGQTADARPLLDGLGRALGVAALGLFAASCDQTAAAAVAAVGALALLVVGAAGTRVRRPAGLPPRWSLVRAAEERWALRSSALLLDGSIARENRERWGASSGGRPRSVGRLPGSTTVEVATVLVRIAPRLVGPLLVAAYLAPTIAGAWTTGSAAAVVALAVGWAGAAGAGPADRWAQAPALARTYPGLTTATVLTPVAVGASLVAVVGSAAVGTDPTSTALLLAGALLVVLRRHGARRREGGELWATTPAGSVPLGTLDRLVAGADVAVVLAVVLAAR